MSDVEKSKLSKLCIEFLKITMMYILPCDLITVTIKASWERRVARQ